VISNGEKVVIDIFEDGVGHKPIGKCSIREPRTIVEIPLMDNVREDLKVHLCDAVELTGVDQK